MRPKTLKDGGEKREERVKRRDGLSEKRRVKDLRQETEDLMTNDKPNKPDRLSKLEKKEVNSQ